MNPPQKRNSLLCPHCRTLVSRAADTCLSCGLSKPGSWLNNSVIFALANGKIDIIKLILVANILLFFVSLVIDLQPASFSRSPFNVLSPSSRSLLVMGSTGAIPLFHLDRWWTLISASYLHGSLLHIVFNMIALYQLGPLLNREYGTSRMIIIYTLSGIGGYLLSSVLGVRFTIGASAAVCGLIGAALYYGKSRGGIYGDMIFGQLGGWALGILLFGFIVPGINNIGHGGGMLTGALIGYVCGYRERTKERRWHTYLSMGCVFGTAIILLWAVTGGMLFLLS